MPLGKDEKEVEEEEETAQEGTTLPLEERVEERSARGVWNAPPLLLLFIIGEIGDHGESTSAGTDSSEGVKGTVGGHSREEEEDEERSERGVGGQTGGRKGVGGAVEAAEGVDGVGNIGGRMGGGDKVVESWLILLFLPLSPLPLFLPTRLCLIS